MIFRKALIIALSLVAILAASGSSAEVPTSPADIPRLTVTGLQELQGRESVLFIDTRTPGQWQRATDKIVGAARLTSQTDLERFVQTVPPHTPIVVYCT